MTAAGSAAPAARVHRATLPKVRRMRFRFGEPEPMNRHFVEGDIVLSHLVALLSGAFPPGEESFIRSVRRFSGEVTDRELKKRVAGFIGQEATHGQQHRHLNEKLVAKGYPLVRVLNFGPDSLREQLIVRLEKLLPASVHLAGTAAAEHYTTMLAERVLSSEELQAIPAAPEVRNLLNWHALEELEHKTVAFDVYRAVGGTERTRIAVMALFYLVTIPGVSALVALSILTDPTGWRPIKVTRRAIDVYRGPLLRGLMIDLARYLRPGFHPTDIDTDALLQRWERELFGEQGELAGHLK